MLKGKPSVVVHTFNLKTQEAEKGGSLSLRPDLQSKIWNSQGYTEKLYLKIKIIIAIKQKKEEEEKKNRETEKEY